MQYELILQDELDNSYKCKYISSDNIDKSAICILELLHITNNILTFGTKLFYYDANNDIYYMYIIYNIYNINNVSLTCKLYYGGSEFSAKQLFAHMVPDHNHTNNKNPLWQICSNLILNQIFDYEMCKIFNDNDQYIYVILKKNYRTPNTYIIKRPNKKELTFFKNQTNFSIIDIVPNDFSKGKIGSKLYHNWCKLLNFSQKLIIFDNKTTHNQEDVQEDVQEDTDEDVQEDIQEDTDEDVQEDIQEDVQEDVQEDIQEDVQEDVQEEVQEIIQENVQEEVQENDSIKTLDENDFENEEENNIIHSSTTSSLTDKEDLSEEIIEKDTFYDDVIETNNHLDNINNFIFGKNITKMPYNNNLFKQDKSKKNDTIMKTNNKIKLCNKIKEDSSNNYDIILEVLSKFDEFYEKNIIKNLIEKDKIYERYTSILDNCDKKFINQKVEVEIILDHILNTFKTHLPSVMIDEKCILDTIQSDMRKMAEKLMNKTNEIFLLPFIKPFNLTFSAFKEIEPMKRKVLLIYYSLSEKKDDLTTFLGIIPSILFQYNDDHITNTGFIQEEKVTIFHMEYMYNLFNIYLLKLLHKNKKNIMEFNFKDVLIKLLYQYFSCYIIHNELTAIMIVKNSIYEHYIELIQCHLQFLFPDFKLGIDCDYTRLKTVKESYNRYMLKYRIMNSSLLKTLDENQYYIMAGFMSKLLNSYFYCPDTGKIANYIKDEDIKLHAYFEDFIKKEFLNGLNNLKNI